MSIDLLYFIRCYSFVQRTDNNAVYCYFMHAGGLPLGYTNFYKRCTQDNDIVTSLFLYAYNYGVGLCCISTYVKRSGDIDTVTCSFPHKVTCISAMLFGVLLSMIFGEKNP